MNEGGIHSSLEGVAQDGFGAKLARAREAHNWTVAQVAEQLKLTARQVEAIEAEDLARLPGPVFVRGFIRNYARLVELDPEELLAATDVRQAPTETITAPSEGVRLGGSSLGSWLLLPLLLFGLFLLMVSGMYYWLNQGEITLIESPQGELSVAPIQPMPAAEPSPAEPEVAPVAEVSQVDASATIQGAPVPTPAMPAAVETAVPPHAPAPAAEPTPTAPRNSGRAVLHFHALEDAWIRVDDRDGQRYTKLLRAGTSDQVRGNPPFRLVIGNAASVRLEYNQQSIDLKPFIGKKVARLTLE